MHTTKSIITMDSETWIGSTVIDGDDNKLGTIEAIYFDEQTGEAQWMAVKTGLFGNKHHFVPLAGAAPVDEVVRTPYDKRQVDDVPKIDPDEDLRDDQVVELYRYYGLSYDAPAAGDRDILERDHDVVEPDRDIVDRDLAEPGVVPPAAAPGTQAQDDMLVATGHAPEAGVTEPVARTQAEEDTLIATGRSEPYRAA